MAPGDLAGALGEAGDGEALCLLPGLHAGPVRIARRVAIWGPRDAVVRSAGDGTTVSLDAPGSAVLGLTVDGSGGRFDLLDAAVRVHADDARVEGVLVRNAVFGVLVEKSHRVVVSGCEVEGARSGPLGLRGDGIRLWETRESVVDGNRVTGGRDVVVWYSPGNRVTGNVVSGGRYGTHFMYSHDNVVADNTYLGNVVGIFVMYSRNVRLERNVLALGTGAAGIGLGIKESGNVEARRNVVARNTVGLYVDMSPLQLTDANRFEENAFQGCDTAIAFHSSGTRNEIVRNVFSDNQVQVRVDGGGDAMGVTWRGNAFDDYRGYDFDRDGVGDVPYQLIDFTGSLESRSPTVAFFHGSASLALLDAFSRAFPLLEPRVVLRDPAPLMRLDLDLPRHAR